MPIIKQLALPQATSGNMSILESTVADAATGDNTDRATPLPQVLNVKRTQQKSSSKSDKF